MVDTGGPDAAADLEKVDVADTSLSPDAGDTAEVPAPTDTGTGPDSDPADVGEAGDVDFSCTLTDTYTYGNTGGLTAFDDESILSPPANYRHRRIHHRPAGMVGECSPPLPACRFMDVVTLKDITRALDHPDVQAAFATPTPLTYGRDARPVDGTIYSVKRSSDGHGMLVGSPCAAGDVGCRAIPGGLDVLVGHLKGLDQQLLSHPSCQGL